MCAVLNLPRDGHVPVHLRVEVLLGPRPTPATLGRARAPAPAPAPAPVAVVAARRGRLKRDARLLHARSLLQRPLLLLLANLLRLSPLLLRALTLLLPATLLLHAALLALAHLLLAVRALLFSDLRLEILIERFPLPLLGVLPGDAEGPAEGLHLLGFAPGDGVRVVGPEVGSGEGVVSERVLGLARNVGSTRFRREAAGGW